MSIQLKEENDGKVLVVQVTGKLVETDYEQFVPEFKRLAVKHGKLRLLFDMNDFQGWDACVLWVDTKFAANHFSSIARLAMVGEKRWQHGMAMFCKPFTSATIRYFDYSDAHTVRQWLDKT